MAKPPASIQGAAYYDEVAWLILKRNDLILEIGKSDDIDDEAICDFAIEYEAIEFVKTKHFKIPFHNEVAKTQGNIASLYKYCLTQRTEKFLISGVGHKKPYLLKEKQRGGSSTRCVGGLLPVYERAFKIPCQPPLVTKMLHL